MAEVKAVDLDKEVPFNYTEIIKKTNEFIDMLVSLDIAYPVLSHTKKKLKNSIIDMMLLDKENHIYLKINLLDNICQITLI